MKKNRFLILLLCLCLMVQSLFLPALATETEEEETLPLVTGNGDATVSYGCRTIDAQAPLGGTARMLETATSALIYEGNTDTVIYAYNPDLRVYPGSLTKMLTALIAIERGNLNDEVYVSTTSFSTLPVGALNAKLKYGELVTLEQLLYMMILESANDAALVIAEYIAGSEAEFVKLMNQRAAEIGCTNTYLVNCHGLDNSEQYTTARDIGKITLACTQNDTFKEIFAAKSYTVPATNKTDERKLKSINYLIEDTIVPKFNDNRVTGGMPGYVSEASGACIAITADKNGMECVMVIMGAEREYSDRGTANYYGNFEEIIEMLEYTYNGFSVKQVIYPGQAIKTFQVGNGSNDVVGAPDEEIYAIIPSGVQMDNLIEKYTLLGGGISAPIDRGEEIAIVQLWYGASCIAETTLYALSDVRTADDPDLIISGTASRDDSNITGFLKFVGAVCLIFLAAFAVYLAYNSFMRSRRRARRRRRRANRRRMK